MAKQGGHGGEGALRDWACESYNPTSGRPASSLEPAGKGAQGGGTAAGSTQKSAAHGVEQLNRSGSGDPGRNKHGGSTPS